MSRTDWPLDWVYREDLEAALRRCSKRDRELILGWHDRMTARRRQGESDAIRNHQTYRDLAVIVKDQAAHIANLEAQLMPFLRDGETGDQEAMAL